VVSVASYQGEPGSVVTRVVLWDTQNWKRRCMLMNETWTFDAAIAFWPKEKRLLAATAGIADDGTIQAWEVPSGTEILDTAAEGGYTATIAPSGRWLVTSDKGNSAFLRDPQSGEKAAVL